MPPVLVRHATLPDGTQADLTLDHGRIATVAPAGSLDPSATAPVTYDLAGYLLLAAPVEPHAHLDKALTADLIPNPTGDLLGAVVAYQAHYPDRSVPEITGRARAALFEYLANGCTAVRTHVDIGPGIELRGVEALLALRDEFASRLDLQIVGLVGRPTSGAAGQENRDLLAAGLAAGIDVVGGCPHLDPVPADCLRDCFDIAVRHGRPLDLHLDENLSPDSNDLAALAELIGRRGFDLGVTASHCVSLGMQPADRQHRVAEAVAAAGISVITLPQTNLFLQGRDHPTATPRGLTAVQALLSAGVNVAAGGDNFQDPFNLVGRADPLETAALAVAAAHLDATAAYHAVSNAARRALGLGEVTMRPGDPAELLAIRAGSVREAVASACADRLVFHRGVLVARTSVSRGFPSPES